MRTAGTFQEVYEAAKSYNIDEEVCDHRPINPVVRREDGRWMLESGLNSAEDADFEVTLEEFDNWFREGYRSDWIPTEADIEDFVAAHRSEEY